MRPFIPYGFDSIASLFTPFWDFWNSFLPAAAAGGNGAARQAAPMVGLVNLHYAPSTEADKGEIEREVAAYARQMRRLAEAILLVAARIDRTALTEAERRTLDEAEDLAAQTAKARPAPSALPNPFANPFDVAGFWGGWNRAFLPPFMTDPDAGRIAIRSMFLPGR